jgi:hypothetical protein
LFFHCDKIFPTKREKIAVIPRLKSSIIVFFGFFLVIFKNFHEKYHFPSDDLYSLTKKLAIFWQGF